jgi:predicted kinase
MDKILYIVRGLPESGKSAFAKSIAPVHFEADMFFMNDGEYKFDFSKIKEAHQWCQESTRDSMVSGSPKVAVSNTFTQEWEMKPYYEMAEKYGYMIFSVIVENRHGGKNIHGVPDATLDNMRKRFEFSL